MLLLNAPGNPSLLAPTWCTNASNLLPDASAGTGMCRNLGRMLEKRLLWTAMRVR
jgi:hypothetical protein